MINDRSVVNRKASLVATGAPTDTVVVVSPASCECSERRFVFVCFAVALRLIHQSV